MGSVSYLASPSATRAVLERHGLATKKALGQNFLINDDILAKIVSLAELDGDDAVLEVGPGIGTLTIALLKNAMFGEYINEYTLDCSLWRILTGGVLFWLNVVLAAWAIFYHYRRFFFSLQHFYI